MWYQTFVPQHKYRKQFYTNINILLMGLSSPFAAGLVQFWTIPNWPFFTNVR